jgi:hypothetical protein
MARGSRLDTCGSGEISDGIFLIAMNYRIGYHTVFIDEIFYFFTPLNTKINLSHF